MRRHTLLDGAAVTLESAEVDLDAPATSSWVAQIGSRQQEFTAGNAEFGEVDARATSGVALTESYRLGSGRLRTGARLFYEHELRVHVGIRVGVWQGAQSSIATHLYRENGVPSVRDVIALFEQFDVAEEAGAAVMRPRRTSRASAAGAADLMKELPGVGLATIKPLETAELKALPAWGGTAVEGGELFVNRANGPREHFVLVGEGAMTTVVPAGGAALDDRAVQRLASVVIRVERAAG